MFFNNPYDYINNLNSRLVSGPPNSFLTNGYNIGSKADRRNIYGVTDTHMR